MIDNENAEGRFAQAMDEYSQRILRGGPGDVYETLLAGGYAFGEMFEAPHGPDTYRIFMSISDLVDDPQGPHSEVDAFEAARKLAEEWNGLDASDESLVHEYFERWSAQV
ncbi:hypothetical protein [Leifsonia xyli]|uniref:hypothetical protein n=1 Tax=Leifsonia xyli TaxID=1575 RepID=UPI000B16AE68